MVATAVDRQERRLTAGLPDSALKLVHGRDSFSIYFPDLLPRSTSPIYFPNDVASLNAPSSAALPGLTKQSGQGNRGR